MPLDVIMRSRCDQCGVEHSKVVSLEVKGFPVILKEFGLKAAPAGWSIVGTTAICPTCSRVKVVHQMPPSRIVQ